MYQVLTRRLMLGTHKWEISVSSDKSQPNPDLKNWPGSIGRPFRLHAATITPGRRTRRSALPLAYSWRARLRPRRRVGLACNPRLNHANLCALFLAVETRLALGHASNMTRAMRAFENDPDTVRLRLRTILLKCKDPFGLFYPACGSTTA